MFYFLQKESRQEGCKSKVQLFTSKFIKFVWLMHLWQFFKSFQSRNCKMLNIFVQVYPDAHLVILCIFVHKPVYINVHNPNCKQSTTKNFNKSNSEISDLKKCRSMLTFLVKNTYNINAHWTFQKLILYFIQPKLWRPNYLPVVPWLRYCLKQKYSTAKYM